MEFLDNAIRTLVERIVGAPGIKLYDVLDEKENVSEFKIAEDMKMGINQVRSILYKLSSYNLVYSTRKKDKQKGWYVYFWTFNKKYAKDYLVRDSIEKIRKLNKTLGKEKDGNFYMCSNKCIRMDLSEAMEQNFKCPECEKIVEFQENSKKIREIEEDIVKINQSMETLKQCVVPELPSERKAMRKKLAEERAVKRKKEMIRKSKLKPKKKVKPKKKPKHLKKKFFRKFKKPSKPKKKPKHFKKKFEQHKKRFVKPKTFKKPNRFKKLQHKRFRKQKKSHPQKSKKQKIHKIIQRHEPPKQQTPQEKKGGFFKKLKKIRF